MRYIKIRGYKKKISKIQGWINENLELDTEFLNERKYMYTKVYVDPWDSLTLTKSHIPEPKGKAKMEIIKGLEKNDGYGIRKLKIPNW
ncbi:hypothetical protein MM213_11825 [Belliella sp. R4-6]|uniref:Uncharacterized protein n=1 Tax=Belliella alkalica TaxID=1730871 RepID=A0ABS9VDR3_9BACT|nr:hypothetical protein [Belliella alkalica]MCH7414180.1 hypothetical protein [Belliella alkalica]